MSKKTLNKYLLVTNFVFLVLLWLPVWTHAEYHESVYYILLIGIFSNGLPMINGLYKESLKNLGRK